jgi:uncharacterized protein YjiK
MRSGRDAFVTRHAKGSRFPSVYFLSVKNGDRSNDNEARAAPGAASEMPSLDDVAPSPPSAETVPTERPPALKAVRKLGKKQKALLKDAHRPLKSWERYRALTDALDEAHDLVDLGDHKARFALIISGALNVFLYALGASTDIIDNVPQHLRFAVALLAGLYAVLSVYLLIQAVESLRPRRATPYVHYSADTGGFEEYPIGLRFYEDILSRDMEAYRKAWREVRVGQLNNEVAVQLHALAAINRAKFAALDRLYRGLQLMTVFAVVMLLMGTAFIFHNKGEKLKLKKHAFLGVGPEKEEEKADDIFAKPERVADLGVKEPSGVVFHPRLGHLFVVGDEGTLAELDAAGKRIDAREVKGDLEDVTVYTPSGELMLVAEKQAELILYDPVARQEKKRWKLDTEAVLGEEPGEKNEGFEGLAFRPERGRKGGGLFYLAHQRTPAMVVALVFDPASPPGRLGAEAVVARWPLTPHEDLTAVSYVPSIDRVLVLCDKSDRILILAADGTIESEVTVPGEQQEGLAIDEKGDVWLADDKDKSLLRLPGGLAALEAHVKGGSPPAKRSDA